MALVSVMQATPRQPKKGTWDRIVEGISVANSVLGTALNAGKLYNEFEQTGIDREKTGILKDQLDQDRFKTSVSLLDKIEPAQQGDPMAFRLDLSSIGGPASGDQGQNLWKMKSTEMDPDEWIKSVTSGNFRVLDSAQASAFQAEGRPVTQIRIKGVSQPYSVAFDTDQIAKNLQLGIRKQEADIGKTEAETKKLMSEAGKETKDAADQLRREFEGKPEIRGARDVIAIADRADQLVKLNTVPAQVALAYGFIRAQGPGVVTEQELNLASRGAFTDELLQKFGWKRLTDGRFMTPEQAKNVADTLKITGRSLQESIGPQINTFRRLAEERGLNPDDVVMPLEMRQKQLFMELDPSYLKTKDPKEMTDFEKDLFKKTYGGGQK